MHAPEREKVVAPPLRARVLAGNLSSSLDRRGLPLYATCRKQRETASTRRPRTADTHAAKSA